jgi:hypothetical protein
MSAELLADDDVGPMSACEPVPGTGPLQRTRPNVSGDLPTVFQAAPLFRRTVAGYDRFQVDTYVQWAEEELATADREREHLVAGLLRTRAELEEAQQLLSHSAGGGEFLQVSRRIGSMLAVAADEAEGLRAEAQADRSAAAAEAERMGAEAERTGAEAERLLADAEVEAGRRIAEAAAEAETLADDARRTIDAAERTDREARERAEARLAEARAVEQRAAEHAGRIRQEAVEEASAVLLRARDEVVRMLGTGREERRRADAEAAARRERLDRDAATRLVSLRAEVDELEHRRAALLAELELLAEPVAGPTGGRLDVHLARLLEWLGWPPRSLRTR